MFLIPAFQVNAEENTIDILMMKKDSESGVVKNELSLIDSEIEFSVIPEIQLFKAKNL